MNNYVLCAGGDKVLSQNKGNRILKTFSALSVIIIISKIAGFIKQMVIAGSFGATIETDLIQMSQGLISNTDYIIVQTLSTAFVALYIHTKETDEEKAKSFTSNVVKALLIIVVGIALIMAVCSPVISRIIAPTYDANLSAKLARYVLIFSPTIVLYVLTAVFTSILNANKRFILGELSGLIQSVVLVLTVVFLKKYFYVNTLVIGFFIYSIINPSYLGLFSKKYIGSTRGNPFKDTKVIEFLKMCGPLLLGYSMVFINQQVDKIIVSGMEAGTVTAMSYGAVLSNLVTTLIASLCTVLFTNIAELTSRGEHSSVVHLTERTSLLMIVILLPITVVTCFASNEIVTVAFGRGAFDQQAISGAAYALIGYGIGFIAFAMKSLYARVLYSNKDTKTPMVNSSIGIVINIILSIILSKSMGVLGVTLASSISEFVAAGLNLRSIRKILPRVKSSIAKKDVVLAVVATVLCLVLAIMLMNVMSIQSAVLRFAVYTIVCLAAGYVCTWPIIRKFMKEK